MRGILTLLLLVALAPSASAVEFGFDVEDARGDVRSAEGRPLAFPSADILRLTSALEGADVVQRVEVVQRPTAPGDSILVRSWFHDSENGSFFVVDMEVRGDAPTETRFRPVVRRGEYTNATPLDATYRVENATWVFVFPAAAISDATCFDPGAFTEHGQRAGFRGFDDAYQRTPRACVTAPEPTLTPAPSTTPAASTQAPTPTPPPGSETPTPGAGAWGALLAAALALTWRRIARRS